VRSLIEDILSRLPAAEEAAEADEDSGIRIALIGRPNVGKSTLANRILGEERVLAFDQPGTTRDSVFLPFTRDDVLYTLIDTAGVRRRSRVQEAVEKFSVIKALQAMQAAQVTLLILDAQQGVTDQDATLAGYAAEAGRALLIAVNKWDGLSEQARARVKQDIERKLPFAAFAEVRYISALHGSGVGELFGCIQRCHASATQDIPTAELNRLLEQAVQAHPPPLVRGRRVKLRYAHQGGRNPPIIVIHGNQTERLPEAYRRYLENSFRRALGLVGTPIRLELKTGENPFQGKRNRLTPRQQRHRKRLLHHAKRR
jgi:GTP-binding protein